MESDETKSTTSCCPSDVATTDPCRCSDTRDAASKTDTVSVCPVCLKPIAARHVLRDDAVYLEKTCSDHGAFSTKVWSDGRGFDAWAKRARGTAAPGDESALKLPCPTGCADCTGHRVKPCCVLFEVTQRCNLECPVCFAKAGGGTGGRSDSGEGDSDPTLSTIASWYDRLFEKAGICHIQLSGGEPTLRDDLDEIIRIGREKGFEYFQLNTNGIRLAGDEGLAQRLKDAGLTCVFLQFDGMDARSHTLLRGRDLTETKKTTIDNCAAAKLPVVLVPTLAQGVNDIGLMELIRFGIDRSPVVRGVHIQPLSFFGRYVDSMERLTVPDVLALLEEQSGGMIKAAHFAGGAVENPHCSFSAYYQIDDDLSLAPFGGVQSSCCGSVEESVTHAQDIQMRRWGTKLDTISETRPEAGTLDEFLWKAKSRSFSITGMAFMDADTLDFDRLSSCYIFIMDAEGNPIPFCAYNLTDRQGVGPYRKQAADEQLSDRSASCSCCGQAEQA